MRTQAVHLIWKCHFNEITTRSLAHLLILYHSCKCEESPMFVTKLLESHFVTVYYQLPPCDIPSCEVHNYPARGSLDPPLVPILSLMNPIHTITHYFFKINFNIIPHQRPRLSNHLFLPVSFPIKPLYAFVTAFIRNIYPSHITFLDLITLITSANSKEPTAYAVSSRFLSLLLS
jgi:hypothetical protein